MRKYLLLSSITSFVLGQFLIFVGAYRMVNHLSSADHYFKEGLLLIVVGGLWLFIYMRKQAVNS
jgi:hypothetical protein